MRYRDLNGFDIQFLRERHGVLDRLARLTWQAENEVAMNHQPQLMSVLGELACAFQGGALLDVFENLLIARFIPNDEQAASSFALRFQSLIVRSHA